MKHDQDNQDLRQPATKPAERITLAQDGYPQTWAFGSFGAAYRRTWTAKPGDAIPELKGKGRR